MLEELILGEENGRAGWEGSCNHRGDSGIGLATAKRFVKEGAYVFIAGRRQAELDSAVSLIGKNVTAVQGDASKLEDLDRLYEVVRKVKGRVDVVFANAAS